MLAHIATVAETGKLKQVDIELPSSFDPTPVPGARQPERGALDAIVAHQAPGVRYYLVSSHPERDMCPRCLPRPPLEKETKEPEQKKQKFKKYGCNFAKFP